MGRDGDYCDDAPIYVQCHGNGCFSEVEETLALPRVKLSSDHYHISVILSTANLTEYQIKMTANISGCTVATRMY